MVNPVLDDQYTAARVYFASVVGLLLVESLIRLPGYLVYKFQKGHPKKWHKASHWKPTVWVHKLISLPSPVPLLTNYHVPDVLRFGIFAALNIIFGLNINRYTTDYKLYGWMTIANGGLALLLPSRTNLFSLLLRIPSPILLQYHRWIGVATVVHATVHVAYNLMHNVKTHQIMNSFTANRIRVGLMAWIALVLMLFTALPIVRRRNFELFYYTHALFFVFMVGALIHTTNGPEFLLPGFFLWVVDRAIRFAYNFRRVEVQSVTHYEGDLTKFRVKGRMLKTTHPGQIVWVQIPNASFLNWHPFTVASAPDAKDGIATIAIRGLGGYTSKVQYVTDDVKREDSNGSGNTKDSFKIRLDGPYGVGRVNWGAWPVTVLVAGGIGITPGISIASHLINKAQKVREQAVSHIHLLWVVKEASHIEWFAEELREMASVAAHDDIPVTFDISIYVTGLSGNVMEASEPKMIGGPWKIHAGRPDVTAWFAEIKSARQGLDAAVNACGPRGFIDAARKAATKSSSENGIFYVEEEVFEL